MEIKEKYMTISRDDLQKVYAEKAAQIGRTRAYAETIVQMIQPTHTSLEIFSAFMPVKTYMPGDNLRRVIRRGKYNVRTLVQGQIGLTDKTDLQDAFYWMFDHLYAGTSHNLAEIESGDIGTVDEMKTELQADLIDEIVHRVFELLGTIWNASDTPRNYVDASSGGLTSTVLDALIENIIDEVGSVKAIVGTRKALLPIYKFAGYKEYALTGTGVDAVGFAIPEKLLEFANTGKVSTYYGAPLIEMPNERRNRLPNRKNKVNDTTKVIVVGADAGEIALFDDFKYQDYTDPRTIPPTYYLHGHQAYSMAVSFAEAIGVAKVSATSPY